MLLSFFRRRMSEYASHYVVFHRDGGGLSVARIVFAFSQFAVVVVGGGRKYVIISSPRRLRVLGALSEFGTQYSAIHATCLSSFGPTPSSVVGTAGRTAETLMEPKETTELLKTDLWFECEGRRFLTNVSAVRGGGVTNHSPFFCHPL